MTFAKNALDIPSSELEEAVLGMPTAQSLGGDITVRKEIFFTDEDHGIISGTWEIEPSQSRWEFTDRGEVVTIISGHMTVQQDGEEPVELTAGTTAVYPLGWKGVWTAHELTRKVFVIYQRRS